MKKLKSLLKKTQKVRLFVWKGILKNAPLSSKIHCYVKNRNGLFLNRYRSNYPFYSANKSLIQRVNFGQFKLPTDIEKNPGPSVYVDVFQCHKNESCSILSRKRCSIWRK